MIAPTPNAEVSTPLSNTNPLPFVFFGTPKFAEIVLSELENAGYIPSLVVTAPDKPKGRKLLLTPSDVKLWAQTRNIPVLTPASLANDEIFLELAKFSDTLFIVAAYGKIIPQRILDIPHNGVLNVHPSLLPKYRGSSPIESAILSDDTGTGVSIMELDAEMDHGPIVAQEEHTPSDWPPKGTELTDALAHIGGKLLATCIPSWITEHHSTPQEHGEATYTKKIVKEDGLIDISGDPVQNYKKFRAYDEWPGAFFFVERNGKQIRVKITDATLKENNLTITRVVPEGKNEMSYEDFLRGMK